MNVGDLVGIQWKEGIGYCGSKTGAHVGLILYKDNQPHISLKLQEMFGEITHPTVAGKPMVVTLLSPAGRPLQTTTDLPGFWKTSYYDVRKDMRGRYPKHPWPENPEEAVPSLRIKGKK